MAVDQVKYQDIVKELGDRARLVAVSKTKPVEDIRALYELGQRDFGENYVQELVDKQPQLPSDIRWHFIGHLQSNKVKYIAPFVYLVHGVDSLKLLKEIDKQAARCNRTIPCLLQVHIAREETKFGLDAAELAEILQPATIPLAATPSAGATVFPSTPLRNTTIRGLMGMASLSDDHDPDSTRQEFRGLKALFDRYFQPTPSANTSPEIEERPILSMGMSGDYKIALAEGSNMVRIGSLLFGSRS